MGDQEKEKEKKKEFSSWPFSVDSTHSAFERPPSLSIVSSSGRHTIRSQINWNNFRIGKKDI